MRTGITDQARNKSRYPSVSKMIIKGTIKVGIRIHTIISFAACLCLVVNGYSQDDNQRTRHLNLDDFGLAIQGYDPVSYFSEKGPQKGNKEFSLGYKGAIYYFISPENRTLFRANPEKYEPEYGGWCAYAIGLTGEKVVIDPETYKIIDDKVFLFYNFYFTNTLKKWNQDEARLKRSADTNWEGIIESKEQ